MNIWSLCEGMQFINNVAVDPWRVVEDQHILSSRDLVDSVEEHDLLEELIEESKPPVAKDKNYLIFTPFRYPPLKYGSRFGGVFEPSLWYGSLELETAFTEVAYYRLKFFDDTNANLGYVELSMTAFTASLNSSRGVDLTERPFNQYMKHISDQNTYEHSQSLGSAMREAEVEVVLYYSARTREPRKNIAAFSSSVFQLKKNQYVQNQQNWKCITSKDLIEFTRVGFSGKKRHCYSRGMLAS